MVNKLKFFTNDSSSIIDNNSTINHIVSLLLLFSFILIPFDDLPYFTQLGNISRRAAIYPLIIIIAILFFLSLKKLKVFFQPCIENFILIIFYIWVITSAIINISTIFNNFFKGASGFSKAAIHFTSLTLVILIYYGVQFILSQKNIRLIHIRTAITISFIPVILVSSIEILNLLNVFDFSSLLSKITYYLNLQLRGFVYGGRVRGVSAEASYLGMYCAFIFPWLLSYLYIHTTKLKQILSSISLLFLTLVVVTTKSRTATILLIFELVCITGLFLLFYKNIKAKIMTLSITIILGVSLVLYPTLIDKVTTYCNNRTSVSESPTDEPEKTDNKNQSNTSSQYNVSTIISSVADDNNLSNIARSAMQNSALKIGIDNPIFGVGIGQFAFNFSDYIKESDLRSHEVQVWLDNENPVWPPVHSLYHRFVSETGFIGALLYICFIFIICLKLFIKIIKEKKDTWGIFLLVSYASIAIGSLTIDTFLLTHFWLMSGIIVCYNKKQIN